MASTQDTSIAWYPEALTFGGSDPLPPVPSLPLSRLGSPCSGRKIFAFGFRLPPHPGWLPLFRTAVKCEVLMSRKEATATI